MKRKNKIKIWRIIAFISLIMCLLFGIRLGARAQNAGSILDKAASTYESSNGLTAFFSMNSRSDVQKISESFEGTINMRGDKFVLKTPDMITWFDGKTQWTYMDHSDEVNISTPTGDELQMTNPALLLNSYKKGFTPAYIGESTAPSGKAAYNVELTPKKKGDILKVELQIEKFSNLPASITITAKNGISNTIRISKIKTGVNQLDNFFVFNKKDYPDAEIVDLR